MNETEKALEMAREFTAKLMEYSDSVQVFLTVHDPSSGITRHVTHGAGNWFAREGQVREWVVQNEEHSRSEAHNEDE